MRQFLAYYFSFTGRMSRSQFWLKFQLPALIFGALYMALYTVEYPHMFDMFTHPNPDLTPEQMQALMQPVDNPLVRLVGTLFGIAQLALFIAILSANVRRYHDRDKSGWWVLIMLIPFIGPLWLLIEIGFLRGTRGANRFGADPVARTISA